MNSRFLTIFLLILLILAFRMIQFDGYDKRTKNPELEEVAAVFEPLRNYFSEKSLNLLPQPQSSLLAGMVLGVKEDMPPEFKKALRNTSTIHMVVVSGQNLTLLSGFILLFAPLLGRKKTVGLSLGIVVFYALLTGFQIPVMRAAIMVTMASLAQLFNREGDSFWILVLTAMAMLFYDPNWILSISFQLSFLATFGVVVVAPEIVKRISLVPELIKQDLAATLSAQALTWPVIAASFHQFSLVGIGSNLLTLWTVPFIMITGAASVVGAIVHPGLGQVLALFPGVLLTYFADIVWFFNQPWASMYVGKVSPVVWGGYYLLLLGVFLIIKKINTSNEAKNSL